MITCSPILHVMFIVDVLISQIFWLVKLMYSIRYFALRFNLRASIFQKFPGDMLPDPPSISMLHMLIVLHIQNTTL